MLYIAHRTDDGRTQTIKEHLKNTSEIAMSCAIGAFQSLAEAAAIGHDIGKYTDDFQKRINHNDPRVEHAIYGAKEYEKMLGLNNLFLPLLEYCIAGHHSGLPDGGSEADMEDAATLFGRMKRICQNCDAYKEEVLLEAPDVVELLDLMNSVQQCYSLKKDKLRESIELYAFFTKYIFSCLTDADYIDTERFCNPDYERGLSGDFTRALALVEQKLLSFPSDTRVRKARTALLTQATNNSISESDIYLLNMPTGSGKTLCSLKIALQKAASENKKRILYVIPYTSIIEQTAETFADVLGDSIYVLQHHSNYTFEEESEMESTNQKLKRTCENWDAPLIVTTSVQFFQSFYHFKSSKLRKLHNLADAVIIFDEIHLIPMEYLQPCLRAVGYVTKYLNSTAVFLSATMPDYTQLFDRFMPNNRICELIADKSCFQNFNNCTYVNLKKTTFENVAQKAQEYESALIIVNSRKSAHYVYSLLSGRKFHLSTYMTPYDRTRIIEDIKSCLKRKEKITVVSTSLVEAGVDFDFQTVFRQLAGLDSILQSGGRCNREGKRKDSKVFIFETDEIPKGDVGIRANISANILCQYDDISSPECIKDVLRKAFSFQ